MIFNRIKQGLLYAFGTYSEDNNKIVKEILSKEEFEIFNSMMEYDKIHSFRLLKFVKESSLLKENKLYWKLALLHDCGKGKVTFFRRVKKVLSSDKKLEGHTDEGYIKLKAINLELALLCQRHHDTASDPEMIEFQKLDDK